MKLLELLTFLVVTVCRAQYIQRAEFVGNTHRVTNTNLAELTNKHELIVILVQGEADVNYFDLDSFRRNKEVATS